MILEKTGQGFMTVITRVSVTLRVMTSPFFSLSNVFTLFSTLFLLFPSTPFSVIVRILVTCAYFSHAKMRFQSFFMLMTIQPCFFASS